jgi:predicted nuclease of predicted toxin-antitoxin system
MLRLLSDENFNADVVRGLRLRHPNIDLLRIQDIGLRGMDDVRILAWAAENDRIVLTHDRATIPDYAYHRVAAGKPMAGVFVLDGRAPIGEMIQDILLLLACSEHAEWNGVVAYLPL